MTSLLPLLQGPGGHLDIGALAAQAVGSFVAGAILTALSG